MADAERSVLSFRIGELHMAAPADMVSEVLRMPAVTRVPHAPPSLLGLANIRGVVAPVVSLARLLGKAPGARGHDGRLLVLDLEAPVGLVVDEVTSLARRSGEIRPGELYVEGDASVKVVDLLSLLRAEFASLARPKIDKAAAAPRSADAAVADDTVGLATFELAGQLYALPLEQVREVLRLPKAVMALPQGKEADLGAIPFRDRVLPLVSLRALLGLPAEVVEGSRILIVEIGVSAVGLVVDRLDSILRASPSAISAVPAVLNRGGGEAKIAALCRLSDGRGLVSILAPERLFSDESTAHILDSGRMDREDVTETMQSDQEAFVVFQLGDEEYGLPIASVEEVLKLPDRLTRVPKLPAFVEGVMNLRGKVVPVIDQSRRFDSATTAASRRVIITSMDGLTAGFIVDRVSEILALAPDQISDAPQLPGQTSLFRRVGQVDGRMVLLVDAKSLLDQAEADLLKALAKSATTNGD